MAANAAFTVVDGAVSPGSHVFSPAGVVGMSSAVYHNFAEVLLAGREVLTISNGGKAKLRRVGLGARFPVVGDAVVDGITTRKVLSFGTFSLVENLPAEWTEALCKQYRVLFLNAALGLPYVNLADKNEFVW